jgi:RNAse (barnase) inhibitor barstar
MAGPAVLVMDLTAEAVDALLRLAASLGLDAVRIDLAGCCDKQAFLARTADALGFPDWFGDNWDALFDCLADLSWRPAAGYVLILEHAQDMRQHAPEALDTALAVMADVANAWRDRGRPFRAIVGCD